MELLPAFWWAAMDKNGRENPVPTGTISRINQPYTILAGKTGKEKKKENMAVTGTETGEAFSRPFHGYRILYGNSHRFFPVFRPSPVQSRPPSLSLPLALPLGPSPFDSKLTTLHSSD